MPVAAPWRGTRGGAGEGAAGHTKHREQNKRGERRTAHQHTGRAGRGGGAVLSRHSPPWALSGLRASPGCRHPVFGSLASAALAAHKNTRAHNTHGNYGEQAAAAVDPRACTPRGDAHFTQRWGRRRQRGHGQSGVRQEGATQTKRTNGLKQLLDVHARLGGCLHINYTVVPSILACLLRELSTRYGGEGGSGGEKRSVPTLTRCGQPTTTGLPAHSHAVLSPRHAAARAKPKPRWGVRENEGRHESPWRVAAHVVGGELWKW
jgi:hypothetical protein